MKALHCFVVNRILPIEFERFFDLVNIGSKAHVRIVSPPKTNSQDWRGAPSSSH